MPRILIIHGISNQFEGESELHRAWYPALCDGLNRAGVSGHPASEDCFCPFYGDLFREQGTLSAASPSPETLEDVGELTPADIELLQEIWLTEARHNTSVPGPEAYGETLVHAPRFVERALNALSQSAYFADYAPLRFLGDLKQVALYLDDRDMHEKIISRVLDRLDDSVKLVIGHSLGSVVAYEALCREPSNVTSLITVGSPLGLRKVVFEKLTPRPSALQLGQWPGNVKYWTNIAAKGDIVAAQKELAPFFGDQVKDCMVESGGDAHNSSRYLNTIQAGTAVAQALA